MKLNIRSITIAIFVATVWSASANVVLGPTEAHDGPIANGSAPINTTTSQAMIGSGAWQANGISASQYYLYYNGSTATQHGLGQLKVSDLASLNFSTFGVAGTDPNWFLQIYTTPYTGGEASWYGNRLNMEPYLANNLGSTPANQWNTWSTASGPNQLTVNDTGGMSGNYGYYGQPTLADIQNGAINWSTLNSPGAVDKSIDYSQMDILGIVLSTGSGWAKGFNGLVDNVQIDAGAKGSVTYDLEGAAVVPEPSTYVSGALLLLPFGLSTLRMMRKSRKA